MMVSMWHRGSAVVFVLCLTGAALATWPNLLVGFQNGAPAQPQGTAWFISGSALGVAKGMSIEQVVEMSEEDIRARLEKYIAGHPRLGTGAGLLVILDMEHPLSVPSLADVFEERGEGGFGDAVAALRRRVSVARSLLPEAVIGLYGVGTPPSQGNVTAAYTRQIEAAVAAARQGLFAEVQALCPAVYARFCPEDEAFGSLPRAARTAVKGCERIVTAANRHIPIVPLLSFTVFNGNSACNRAPASLEATAQALTTMAEDGIAGVVFWNAGPILADSDISVAQRWASLVARKPSPAPDPQPSP